MQELRNWRRHDPRDADPSNRSFVSHDPARAPLIGERAHPLRMNRGGAAGGDKVAGMRIHLFDFVRIAASARTKSAGWPPKCPTLSEIRAPRGQVGRMVRYVADFVRTATSLARRTQSLPASATREDMTSAEVETH